MILEPVSTPGKWIIVRMQRDEGQLAGVVVRELRGPRQGRAGGGGAPSVPSAATSSAAAAGTVLGTAFLRLCLSCLHEAHTVVGPFSQLRPVRHSTEVTGPRPPSQ